MDSVLRFLQKLNYEFGRFSSQMDSTQWLTLAVVALIIGVVLMRGNPLRSN